MNARRPERGFTLIEIMTVVAIIAILMSVVLYGLGKYRVKAYEDGTRALIESLRSALESYHAEYREYPPDGFDPRFPVSRPVGGVQTPIRGTACLIYFLGLPTIKEVEVGEDVRRQRMEPLLTLKGDMVSGSGELDQRLNDAKTEIVDPFGNPMHYDRVELDPATRLPRINEQSNAGVHTMTGFVAARMHGPDPRREQGGGLETKHAGSYDIWSHGVSVEDPKDDIANWKD